MNIHLNDVKWIEIFVSVFMGGNLLLTLKQNENAVEIVYSIIADGFSSGSTEKKEYSNSELTSVIEQISKTDFDVSYDKEEEAYYSNYEEDMPTEWSIAF